MYFFAKSDNVMILLQRRCHDCIVIKGDGFTDILVLLSKDPDKCDKKIC